MVLLVNAVGLFLSIGAEKALSLGLGPLSFMFSGAVTATGSVIRNVLVCEIPDVIKEDFYAAASLAGGAVFYFYHTSKANCHACKDQAAQGKTSA